MNTTFKQWAKQIEKSNNTFKKANKARKRVMIAKDVIKALEVSLFKSENGSYFQVNSKYDSFVRQDTEKDFRDILTEVNPSCNVCAKGAIFACTVMRRDNVTKGEFNNLSFGSLELSDALGNIFSPDQLRSIEQHFEGFKDAETSNYPFGKYYSTNRMISIMNNIIRNKGTFMPELERKQTGRSAND